MLGGKLTKEKAKELRLQEIALNQLFNDALLLNYAKDLGIIVSDKEVLKEIANIDAFKVDGVFSESRYNSILANLGTNSYNFKNDIRKSLTTDKLFKALNLPPTSLEEKALFATLYLQDKIKYKILTDKEITLNVTDDELKKFWEANKQKYKSAKKYSLDIVKVNSDSMEVTDDEIKEFYNKKKFMFKGNDGKILSLEKAKDDVKHKVQLKKAKKEILKKYLKLKNKKISPDESITVAKINAKIPMQKIVTARVGDYIRAIETPYGYACVYLKKIIKPKVLDFNKAKNLAKADLLSKKKEKALKALGEEAIKDFKDAKESNFFTRDDPDKLNFLSKTEALEFLNYIFSQQNKKGYYIYTDKVLAYEIVDQKLFDKTLFDKNKDTIIDGVKNLKRREIESELLKKLQKIYTIEKYYSDKG